MKKGKLMLIIILGLLITGIGLYFGLTFHSLIPDDNIIDIPTHTTTPTESIPPEYQKPVMLQDSVTITPDYDDAEFQVCVIYSEYVVLIAIHFYVDSVESSHSLILDNPISDVYETTIYKSAFVTHAPNSVITAYLIMSYFDEQNRVAVERLDNVAIFSFLYADSSDPDPPTPPVPPYYPPAVVLETLEYSIEETIITFGFSTTYHELITSIFYYFVIDGETVKKATGEDLFLELSHVESGYYQSLFDYVIFPLDVDVFIYLHVNYINKDAIADSYIVEDFAFFNNPSGTAKTIGINYLFIIISPVVVLAFFAIIKKKKTKEEMKIG